MKIHDEVKKMLMEQGIIYLATSTESGVPNVSPRTAYWVLDDDETIAVCEWYRHKTFWNLQQNDHFSIAVVDVSSFTGWQMNGYSEICTDPKTILNLLQKVLTRSPHAQFNRTMQKHAGNSPPIIQKLNVQEIFTLAPEETSSMESSLAGGGGKKARPEVTSR